MGDEPHESDAVLANNLRKNKPKNTPFRQQTLRAFKPVPTVKSAIIIFTSIGCIFIIIGAILVAYSKDIVEASVRYDDADGCKGATWDSPKTCDVSLEITDDMQAPIFFYYELHNYYQNHRRYVKSKSNDQLKGKDLGKGDLADCDPVISMDDLGRRKEDMEGGKALDGGEPANPCGLIAKSFFNDTFELYVNNTRITILEHGIAWPSDKDRKFKRVDDNWQEKQWLDVEDEHFMVWMRTSGLPNFRKLWGRIESDLDSGNYTVRIHDIYDVSSFDGEKQVVLSTANALGGDNTYLGIAYLVVGGITLTLALVFGIKGYFYSRKVDNLHYT